MRSLDSLIQIIARILAGSPVDLNVIAPQGDDIAPNISVNIDVALEKIVGPRGCPGLVAVALRGDSVIAQGVAGLRKKGASDRAALKDRFHLGSCSKAMTATVAATLIEEQKLHWDTTLAELFGDTVRNMLPAWKRVTLREILSHRAGLRRDPPRKLSKRLIASSLTLPQQRQELAAIYLSQPPKFVPGTKIAYSNLGYIIAGAALEKITGCDWQDLMRERLFRPLGITSAGFGLPGTPGKIDEPWGHFSFIGKPVDPGSLGGELPLFYGPAGLVHMTITDWAKFVSLHLRADEANPYRQCKLLRQDTFTKLHPAQGERYAAGWAFGTRKWAKGQQTNALGRVLLHGGSNRLFFSIVWMAPEIDFAILIACNRGIDFTAWKVSERAANALIHHFCRPSNGPSAGRVRERRCRHSLP